MLAVSRVEDSWDGFAVLAFPYSSRTLSQSNLLFFPDTCVFILIMVRYRGASAKC